MGGSSGGDDDKMSPENLWVLFACVAMSLFGYAFLKPMCAGCCTFRKKAKPKPAEAEPGFRTIKIHPQRAKFKLFPPGEAYYVGGPVKRVEPKKPKKKKSPKLNDKWKKCVQSIVNSNAIRDLASPLPRLGFEEGEGDHSAPKDPQVFAGLSNLNNGRLKLNGGPINNFAKIVQLARLSAARDARVNPEPQAAPDGEDSIETAAELRDDDDDRIPKARRSSFRQPTQRRPAGPEEDSGDTGGARAKRKEKTHTSIEMSP